MKRSARGRPSARMCGGGVSSAGSLSGSTRVIWRMRSNPMSAKMSCSDYLSPVFPVIGLAGPAGSGKSAAASILYRRYRFERLRFAAPLKSAMRALLSELGVSPIRVERMIEGDLKECPVPELSHRSPRYAMQTLGTEWGRDIMAPDFWAAPQGARAATMAAEGRRVVFEDVRFANEAAAVRAARGVVVLITGRGISMTGDHPSEAFDFSPDFRVDNSGSLADLEASLRNLFSE